LGVCKDTINYLIEPRDPSVARSVIDLNPVMASSKGCKDYVPFPRAARIDHAG
jgi:hypothetical protein